MSVPRITYDGLLQVHAGNGIVERREQQADPRVTLIKLDVDPSAATLGAYEPTPERLVLRNDAGQVKFTFNEPDEVGQLAVGAPHGRPMGFDGSDAFIIPSRPELLYDKPINKYTADAGVGTETREGLGYFGDRGELYSIELWFYATVTPDDTDYALILIVSTDMMGDDVVLAAVYTTDSAGNETAYDRLGGAPVSAFQLVTLTFQPPTTPPYIVDAGRYIELRVYKPGGLLAEGGVGVALPRIGGHFTYRLTNESVWHPA